MSELGRLKWLMLAVVVVPALIALMGCDVDIEDEPVGAPPPTESPVMP